LHTTLKYTIRRVVLVLVIPPFRHSLLTPPLEAKLTLVTISPTIVTMKPHELRFGMELFIWFLSTRLLNQFLLTWLLNWFLFTWLLTLFPKKHFSRSAHELDGFLEIVGLWGKHGWSWGFF
jgi:hypothetical protein